MFCRNNSSLIVNSKHMFIHCCTSSYKQFRNHQITATKNIFLKLLNEKPEEKIVRKVIVFFSQ